MGCILPWTESVNDVGKMPKLKRHNCDYAAIFGPESLNDRRQEEDSDYEKPNSPSPGPSHSPAHTQDPPSSPTFSRRSKRQRYDSDSDDTTYTPFTPLSFDSLYL